MSHEFDDTPKNRNRGFDKIIIEWAATVLLIISLLTMIVEHVLYLLHVLEKFKFP